MLTRRVARVMATLLSALLMTTALVGTPTANAAATGTISGVITNPVGETLPDINVIILRYDAQARLWVSQSSMGTKADGAYQFTGLTPGPYRLKFEVWKGRYIGEYYDNAATLEQARDITLADGGAATANAELAFQPEPVISGLVTDVKGTPLSRIEVTALSATSDYVVARTTTTISGSYELKVPRSGSYYLRFDDLNREYAPEYYPDSITRAGAQAVEAVTGPAKQLEAVSLVTGGSVQGSVVDPQGNPVANVSVTAHSSNSGSWTSVGGTTTDASGNYRLTGLATGPHRLSFSLLNHVTQFYGNAATIERATDLEAVAGQSVAASPTTLNKIGEIRVTVVREDGSPFFGATAFLSKIDEPLKSLNPPSNEGFGVFRFYGLVPGDYRLRVGDMGENYCSEWFDNAPALDQAMNIKLTSGATVETFVRLDRPRSLRGQIKDSNGSPVSDAYITALSRDESGSWVAKGYGTSAKDGAFALTNKEQGLCPGTYRLKVGTGWSTSYLGGSSPQTAQDVVLPSDADRTGVEITVPPKPRTPTIAGLAQVGSTLRVEAPDWAGIGTDLRYQWLADGWYIDGQTGPSFTVTEAQVGRKVSVRVTARVEGSGEYSQDTAATTTVTKPSPTPSATAAPTTAATTLPSPTATPAPFTITTQPKVSGKTKVGATLKVTPGTYSQAGAVLTYQWLANGKPITKATKRALKLTSKMRGKKVNVRVIATVTGTTPVVTTTKARTVR